MQEEDESMSQDDLSDVQEEGSANNLKMSKPVL